MKVRALTSFSGVISMHTGEEREIDNQEALNDLLSAKYVEEIKAKANKKVVKADENK